MFTYQRKAMYLLLAMALTLALLGGTIQTTSAHGGVVNAFNDAYPGSSSFTNANCQLCHANPGGGSPWNAYGYSILLEINDNSLSIADAIAAVESLDADGNGTSNIDEINASAQPGWTEGPVNSSFERGGAQVIDLSPPAVDPLDSAPTSVATTHQNATTLQLATILVGTAVMLLAVTVRIRRN